ncbi:T9SS type B sorting domain-containing protein [Spongiimicrobium salis]|uniref:T9SS type B sorting domain-containing protein n=1 Tax=Spongiimicrobium salis TaxID=1667022 RepID=UPI00374D4E5B
MTKYGAVLWSFLCMGMTFAWAQVAPDCATAIPICNNTPVNGGTNGFGSDDFNGAARTGCLEQTTTGAIESNSAWYRFRTSASGQLGFNIGFDASEDWDFALYRSADCDNLGDPIRCNFFDNSDNESFMGVGVDPTGDTDTVLYEDWLDVAPGEDYYLLINNFSNTNTGFSIQFSGNIFVTNPNDALDCSIISNLLGPPRAACENDNIILDATTATATSYTWFMDVGMGFQAISGASDPTFQVLQSALYRVEVQLPDGSSIISDAQVELTPLPTTFPVMDEASCSNQNTFDLSQKDVEALGGQDPMAYMVTYYGSLADALNGVNNLPTQYATSGNTEIIYARTSSIANPRCFDSPQEFQLTALETPILDFPTEVFLCAENEVLTIGDNSPNASYTYQWDSGESTAMIAISQVGTYTLIASNIQGGLVCEAMRTVTVSMSTAPQITDVIINDLQDNNSIRIITDVVGDFEYQLDQGDFQESNSFNNVSEGTHTVTINDRNGCGMVSETITVNGFPKFFTPNGDGRNDLWQISGIENLQNARVFIYDRYGKLLKQLTANTPGWDGTFNGRELPESDYWFKLTYENAVGGEVTSKFLNNHFTLKR